MVDHNPSIVNDYAEREKRGQEHRLIIDKIEISPAYQDFVGVIRDEKNVKVNNQIQNYSNDKDLDY